MLHKRAFGMSKIAVNERKLSTSADKGIRGGPSRDLMVEVQNVSLDMRVGYVGHGIGALEMSIDEQSYESLNYLMVEKITEDC